MPTQNTMKVKKVVLKRLCLLSECLLRQRAIRVSFYVLDTRGEQNEGNYI